MFAFVRGQMLYTVDRPTESIAFSTPTILFVLYQGQNAAETTLDRRHIYDENIIYDST